MNSDISNYLEIIHQIKQRFFDLKEQMNISQNELSQLREENISKNQRITELESEKTILEQQQLTIQTQHNEVVTNYQQQIAELNAQIENFNSMESAPVVTGRNDDEIKEIVREIDDCIELIKSGL